jgi:hypothetical protein
MIPYYRPEMTIENFIRAYASSSPEIEKANNGCESAERSIFLFKGHLISRQQSMLDLSP